MRRVIVCREYPPAPGGGIGTYTAHLAMALAEAGDTVHVIGERWPGAEAPRTELLGGRLVVHRLPVERPGLLFGSRRHPAMTAGIPRSLWHAGGAPAAFAWQVADLLESLRAEHDIELIEGPDYEAPLVVHQLRERSRRGSARTPCLVTLHSPTAMIAIANGAAPTVATAMPAARLERVTVRLADQLVSPSAFLAQQAAAHFGVDDDRIAVIPYPRGDTPRLERDRETWATGSVLFIGRLELRKGIVEWVRAAVRIAERYPEQRFEFVGSDHVDAQLGGSGRLHAMIPAGMRGRFRFHEPRERGAMEDLLGRARLVVVPSRWENFPYTCIEAMSSGVPVLASPHGGMAEMVEHGRSGWIAASGTPEDLADAAFLALATGPEGLATAGSAAASRIRTMCDPATIVARHHRLRQEGFRADGSPVDADIPHEQDALARWLVRTWAQAAPTAWERVRDLGATVRRGIARPGRTSQLMARRLGFRGPGTA